MHKKRVVMSKIIKFITSKEDGNIAFHVGDDINNVIENRKKLALKHNYKYENLKYMNQVHKSKVEIVTSKSENLIDNCDAIVTNEKDIPLMVMVADCIPILMWDLKQGVIAAVHAGRNSTFQRIAQNTVNTMKTKFNCKVEDIVVEMGPSIQRCCYEVSQELAIIVKQSFGSSFVNNRLIDLQSINKKQLEELGVTNIKISNVCTKCSKQPYYSYRLDKHTGRFSAVILLKD